MVAVVALVVYSLVSRHTIHLYQILALVVLIPSIIIHEISHGLLANFFGDDTAKRAGRLTLNPIKHIDPIGTVVLPIVLTLSGFGFFGWARPVPVNVSKLRNPRNQSPLVGLVGPATNIILALCLALIFRLLAPPDLVVALKAVDGHGLPSSILLETIYLAGIVNIALAVFNLIPIPPLDGSALIERLLPAHLLPGYFRIRSFLMIAVLILVVARTPFIGDLIGWGESLWVKLL